MVSDAVTPAARQWTLYIIRCRDDSLYTGITTQLERRFDEHQQGGLKASKYLRGRSPLQLVYSAQIGPRKDAAQLEYRIKQMTKPEKESLIAGAISLAEL